MATKLVTEANLGAEFTRNAETKKIGINLDNKTLVLTPDNKLESPASKDSGLVTLVTTTNVATGATLKLRRIGNIVFLFAGGLRYDLFGINGKTEAGFAAQGGGIGNRIKLVNNQGIPVGFRADASTIAPLFNDDTRAPEGSLYIAGIKDANYIGYAFPTAPYPDVGTKNLRVPIISWTTSDPFPTL